MCPVFALTVIKKFALALRNEIETPNRRGVHVSLDLNGVTVIIGNRAFNCFFLTNFQSSTTNISARVNMVLFAVLSNNTMSYV